MKTPKFFTPILLFAALLFLPLAASGQESGLEQELSQSKPLFVTTGPVLVSVTWEKDDTLSVSPEWFTLAGDVVINQMRIPPSLRTVSENGWLIGEVALQNGDWIPLFSVPGGEDKAISDPIPETDEVVLPPPAIRVPVAAAEVTDSAKGDSTIDPLAVSASDPAFPSKVASDWLQSVAHRPLPSGARRFYVNNRSGDDAAEGKMIHPQSGEFASKGPMRHLAAVFKQVQAGDEIVLIATDTAYTANFLNSTVSEITITPIGDVTIEP